MHLYHAHYVPGTVLRALKVHKTFTQNNPIINALNPYFKEETGNKNVQTLAQDYTPDIYFLFHR